MDLGSLGWDTHFETHFAPYAAQGLAAGRVTLEHQHIYRVHTGEREPLAHVSGRFRHRAAGRHEYPAVGDWVAVRLREGHRALIQAVLPRKSRFSRKVAGSTTEEQVVAANVDTLFLMSGLDDDFNPRRIERYLVAAWEGGARPVVILNKADLVARVDPAIEEVRRVAPAVPVHAISCSTLEGLDALAPYTRPGQTIALLGSSGVGKSTLINRLVGSEVQRTREVRASDSRGRHTTTHRELVALPTGALLIDTPGMRELQLWDTTTSIGGTFEDIERLAPGCFFRNCRHDTEPRCAVRDAVERGELAAERLESYQRLHREQEALAVRQDERLQADQKRRTRIVQRSLRLYKPRE
jgi:ribosome biogenesis GTPase / thiamine phosphate phosphatase